MALVPLNPKPYLASLIGKKVIVRLKWGMEYHATLVNADAYFNLQLADADEYVSDELGTSFGNLLIRWNNILHIRKGEPEKVVTQKNVKEEEEDDDDCLILN